MKENNFSRLAVHFACQKLGECVRITVLLIFRMAFSGF